MTLAYAGGMDEPMAEIADMERPDRVLLRVLIEEYGGEAEDWTAMGSLRRVMKVLGEAHALTPKGATTVEWNVLDNGEPYLQPWTEDEYEARSYSNCVTGPLVYRARTSYPDRVSPWCEPNVVSSPAKGDSDDA